MGLKEHLTDRVMIVDDFPNMRTDLINILKDMGFNTMKESPDGQAAWEELRLEALLGAPSQLIFLDINMPNMDGIQLLKALRGIDSYKSTPIFIVSTENKKDTIINAIVSGATNYIIKPYDPALVKEKVLALYNK